MDDVASPAAASHMHAETLQPAVGGLAPLKPLRMQPLGPALGASSLPPLGGRAPLGRPPAPLPKLSSSAAPPPRPPLQEVTSNTSSAAPIAEAAAPRPLATLPPPLARGMTVGHLPTLGALPPRPNGGADAVPALPPPSSLPPASKPKLPPRPLAEDLASQALSPAPAPSVALPLPSTSSLPAGGTSLAADFAAAAEKDAVENGDVLAAAASASKSKRAPKSALASAYPSGAKASRRLSWNETASVEYYEPCQERPVDNYRHNLDTLQQLRRNRSMACKPDLSFAELVSELDASEGGEGLDCLAPRRADPPPGSWMQNRGMTWGQINQTAGYGSGNGGGTSAGCSSSSAGYSSSA